MLCAGQSSFAKSCDQVASAGHSDMDNLALDPEFADEFTAEPATPAHVAQTFDLVSAEAIAVIGFCPYTLEDVRAWLTPTEGGRCVQLLVREREHDAPVQWWAGMRDPGGENVYAIVRTHPELPEPAGDRLTAAAYDALLNWTRTECASERGETFVQAGAAHGNDAASRRIQTAGFTYARTLWSMSGPVQAAPPDGPDETINIIASQDAATMHRILDEAFADHWGYEQFGLDDWLALQKSMPGHDPTLWRLVELDGAPVSAMILSRRLADEGSLYVQELATLAPYRRRGIGALLLRHASDVARTEGFTKVDLHVDSSNSYDAPALYRRAGLDVRYAWDVFTMRLVA
jgi:ribosomal protein S18 acetylase RimI-like enzyme